MKKLSKIALAYILQEVSLECLYGIFLCVGATKFNP